MLQISVYEEENTEKKISNPVGKKCTICRINNNISIITNFFPSFLFLSFNLYVKEKRDRWQH